MDRQETQNEKVLRHLRTKGEITQMEALYRYGIMRLASRISDLKRQGHPITREIIEVKAADGTIAHVAKYRMEE